MKEQFTVAAACSLGMLVLAFLFGVIESYWMSGWTLFCSWFYAWCHYDKQKRKALDGEGR